MTNLIVLNLGWGVQSFTLVAMSAVGELPQIDFAIHADTTHEQQATYEFAAKYTPWLSNRGVKVITVTGVNTEVVKNQKETPLPAFTLSLSGKQGQLRRQCTDHWKIRPIRKYLRDTYGKPMVNQWLGISLDEVERVRDNDVKWINNVYPLLDLRMTRADCVRWLIGKGLDIPPKSACVFCPYKNKQAWQYLKSVPADYEHACLADEAIRNTRPPYPLFVHPQRKPLRKIDLRSQTEQGQLELWSEECTGNCFL